MISESSKETVPEFYLTSFLPINAIRDLYFLKNCVYVLLSIKQIKNVKNISFVILFTDIVHQILCGIFVLTAVTATMSTCCNTVFFYMNNSLSKDFLSKVCTATYKLEQISWCSGLFCIYGILQPITDDPAPL